MAAVLILAGWTNVAHAAVAVADRGRLWRDHVVRFAICEMAEPSDAASGRSAGCEPGARPLAATEAAKVREAVAAWNDQFGGELSFIAVDSISRSQRGVLFSRSKHEAACSTDRIGRPRIAQRTNVKLGSQCNGFAAVETPVGTILHEMMHVAGFYHEHQRPDRDAYLKSRVPDDFVSVLFDINNAHQWVKGSRLWMLTPYDFQSIMHYPIRNPKKAVLTFGGFRRLEAQGLGVTDPGRRDGFSADDVEGLKRLYGRKPSAAMAKRESVADKERSPL